MINYRTITTACDALGRVRRERFFGLAVAVVAVLAYANSLVNGFVWDDVNIIVNNPSLRDSAIALFRGIDTARDLELTPYYRPLTLLTFLVEERLHGLLPFPMHLVNILLHAANAVLVHRVARSVSGNDRIALLAGLLFAVHPIGSEGVNFLSGGRNTLLASLSVLASYLLHKKSVDDNQMAAAVAGAIALCAGLLAKETAVGILPFIVMLEVAHVRSFESGVRLRTVVRLAPYAVGVLVYVAVRSIALSEAGVSIEILPGLSARLMENIYIIPRYLMSVLWPASVSMRYFVPDDLHPYALQILGAWVCIIVGLRWLFTRGRSPVTLFGLAWLAVFWLPVSGIIPFPSAPLADRYLYIPVIGLWIVCADQFNQFLSSSGSRTRAIGMSAAAILLLTLSVQTIARNTVWKSDVTLFSRYVEQYPEVAGGHHNLGCAYLDISGDLDAADREFQRALELDPYFPRLWTQMGYIRFKRGDYVGAIGHYDEAIAQNPFDAEALLNRAMSRDRLGRYEEALKDYVRFLSAPGDELPLARPQAESRVRQLMQ